MGKAFRFLLSAFVFVVASFAFVFLTYVAASAWDDNTKLSLFAGVGAMIAVANGVIWIRQFHVD